MRIVLGTFSLVQPGGTESYVFTAAHELRRLGHDVIVTAEELGAMADYIEESGIDLARSASELPADCDAVLTNDAIVTGPLAERYPDTRLVHFAHSRIYDHQLPILLPGIVDAVVVGSDIVGARIEALALGTPIVRLRQPVDTERFSVATAIRPQPKRALLLSNYLQGPRRQALLDAWRGAGIECVQVGAPTQLGFEVVPEMAEADIVVAKARAALEGMSCARAVYVFDEFGGDGWVTPDNYAALEASNFGGGASGAPRTPGDLANDLARYRADMGWLNRELAFTHHDARRHATQLVEVLSSPTGSRRHKVTPVGEVSRLLRLNWYNERRAQGQKAQIGAWQERVRKAEQDHARARAELARAHQLLNLRRVRVGLGLGRILDRFRRPQ